MPRSFLQSCRLPWAALATLALALPDATAQAQVVDGRLDAVYGPALSIQTTQTSFLDGTGSFGDPNSSDGSELDGAYGYIADGVLHLFFAGNIGFCCPTMFAHGEQLHVFLDTGPGGQNVLRSDNVGFGGDMAGLVFDADFAPDRWFGCFPAWSLWYAPLPTSSGGTSSYLGQMPNVAPGTLAGGTNPYAITAAIVDSNTGGVTQGCGPGSGAGVATGVELAIPLQAIGSPAGCVRVCAFMASEHAYRISNQVLGPVPAGTCELGAPAGVNFASIPGSQNFTVCASAIAVPAAQWRTEALSLPWPNPFRRTTAFALTLIHAATVEVTVVDAAGRRVVRVFGGELGAGVHTLSWPGLEADGSGARAGVYFLRARVNGREMARRVIFLGGR